MPRRNPVEGRKMTPVVLRGSRDTVSAVNIIAQRRRVYQGDIMGDALLMWAHAQRDAEDADKIAAELDVILADPA